MNLTTVKIADLTAHPSNYNRHPDAQVDALAASLEMFGQFKNVVVRNGVILAGHGLVEAAKRQGLTEIAAVVRDDLTDEQAKALLIADNALPYGAEPDTDALQRILSELADIEVPGVTNEWLDSLGIHGNDMSVYNFDDIEQQMETMGDIEDSGINIVVPKQFRDQVKVWLANGQPQTGPGMGRGVLKRCGLLS